MSKRDRPVSGVWLHFTEDSVENRLANCSVPNCRAKVPRGAVGTPRKSWSNKGMWEHLRNNHKEEHTNAEAVKEETKKQKLKDKVDIQKRKEIYNLQPGQPKTQVTLQALKERTVKWSKDNDQQKKTEANLLMWMCDSIQPYSVVENERFKILMSGKYVTYNL